MCFSSFYKRNVVFLIYCLFVKLSLSSSKFLLLDNFNCLPSRFKRCLKQTLVKSFTVDNWLNRNLF